MSGVQMTSASRATAHYHAAVLIIATLVLAAAVVLDIRGRREVLVPFTSVPLPELCSWHRLTGLDCPGCGLTRSFIALAHGDLRQAWAFNPAGLALFAILLAQFPYRLAQLAWLRTGRTPWHPAGVVPAVVILTGCLLLQWVWRLAVGA